MSELEKFQAKIERLDKLHHPIEIEPPETICAECSFQLSNGDFFGKIVEYPCPTKLVLEEDL